LAHDRVARASDALAEPRDARGEAVRLMEWPRTPTGELPHQMAALHGAMRNASRFNADPRDAMKQASGVR
jgi:hypothetical protein